MKGREILKDLLNKKADENNTIDLNAYAIGLNDGYATLQAELEKAMELIEKKDKELKIWQDMAIGFDESISSFKAMFENVNYDSVGLGCGIEDNNIQSRYDAGRYGFEDALDKVKECLPDLWEDKSETLTAFLNEGKK